MHAAKLQDGLNYLSKLTIKKAFNAFLVLSSYHFSRWFGRVIHWGRPISLSIEPTTACNLRCPECPSGLRAFTRPTGNLRKNFFASTIDQLADTSLTLTLYFQGEPFINPEFLEMVAYAKKANIYTITSTNAHFLDDYTAKKTVLSGLDRLIISIDGASQETYESYRKEGELRKVIQGTKNLVKWKESLKSKTPHIIFQFLVVKPNQHEIPELYRLAEEMKVDEVKLKTVQLYDFENGHPLMPDDMKYSRYVQGEDGKYKLKHKLKNQCWKMWHSSVITWDGQVVPCCFDKDAKHRLGDLKMVDFQTIWKGKTYDKFRQSVLEGRSTIDICKNCTEGCKVWID